MVRILLSGPVCNGWDQLYERIGKLQLSSKFDLLVCLGGIGNVPEMYINESSAVPIKTICIPAFEPPIDHVVRDKGDKDDDYRSVSENWLVLHKPFGIIKIDGLKIAYIAGVYADDETIMGQITYNNETVQGFLKAIDHDGQDIDFFFSAEMPSNFSRQLDMSTIPRQVLETPTAEAIGRIMQKITPKYHICTAIQYDEKANVTLEGIFFQRQPYVTQDEHSKSVRLTRTIALCAVNSISKNKSKKYLHALEISADTNRREIPADATENPYTTPYKAHRPLDDRTEPAKRARRLDETDFSPGESGMPSSNLPGTHTHSQYFYDIPPTIHAQQGRRQPQHRQQEPRMRLSERTECWFCLATPELERHLIVSIGQESYLAMPKGAINGDHILIIPIAHEKAFVDLTQNCKDEIQRYQDCLQKMFLSEGKNIIIIDRSIPTKGATHCHLQMIGIPNDRSSECKRVFEYEGAKYNVSYEELDQQQDLAQKVQHHPYFYADIPATNADDTRIRLLHFVEGKHYMQFGRHVISVLLKVPRRSNWKFCVVDKYEETKLTQIFKQRFARFDFNSN